MDLICQMVGNHGTHREGSQALSASGRGDPTLATRLDHPRLIALCRKNLERVLTIRTRSRWETVTRHSLQEGCRLGR